MPCLLLYVQRLEHCVVCRRHSILREQDSISQRTSNAYVCPVPTLAQRCE